MLVYIIMAVVGIIITLSIIGCMVNYIADLISDAIDIIVTGFKATVIVATIITVAIVIINLV